MISSCRLIPLFAALLSRSRRAERLQEHDRICDLQVVNVEAGNDDHIV